MTALLCVLRSLGNPGCVRLGAGGMAAVLVFMSSIATATSVKTFTLRETVDLSAQVCVASIESVTSRWAKGHHEIESVVVLRDVDFLKGSGPRTIEWVIPGGTIDGVTMKIAGAPEFAAGERWMLFLLPQWKTHPCAGIWQGAFRLESGSSGPIVRGSLGIVAGIDASGFVSYVGAEPAQRGDACCQDAVSNEENSQPPLSAQEFTALVGDAIGKSAPIALADGAVIGPRVWPTKKAVAPREFAGTRPAPATTKGTIK